MKKITIPIILGIISLLVILSYTSVIDLSKAQTEDSQGKHVTKDEYVYKEELLHLGYSVDEINIIESKISNINVKKYLLDKKYDNLDKFVYSPYFKIENLDRYETYYKNNSYSTDEAVIYVNIGLDVEFYTEVTELIDYTDITTLVNKYNKLPEDYSFDDIVTLDKPYSNTGTKKVRQVIYDDLINMIDAAKEENINLFVVSGYRTNKEQNSLFNNSVNKNGMDHALVYSAKAGHSEHQLGLAVDLNTVENGFENTKEYEWLQNNSYKYGFIERYKKGKEFITGYAFEPWHYRYLGVDIATKLYEENITYEEYLVKYAS